MQVIFLSASLASFLVRLQPTIFSIAKLIHYQDLYLSPAEATATFFSGKHKLRRALTLSTGTPVIKQAETCHNVGFTSDNTFCWHAHEKNINKRTTAQRNAIKTVPGNYFSNSFSCLLSFYTSLVVLKTMHSSRYINLLPTVRDSLVHPHRNGLHSAFFSLLLGDF